MRAFRHPAARLESGLIFDGSRIFATSADVGGDAELFQGTSHLIKVVSRVSSTGQALVQARALGLVRTGFRSGHRDAVHRGPLQLAALPPIGKTPAVLAGAWPIDPMGW